MRNDTGRASRQLLAAAIGGSALAILSLGLATPASAAVGTQITFDEASANVAFGSDWIVELTVIASDYGPLVGSAGTVSIFVEGIAGAYAEGMPIFPGGASFFAQPDAQPALG